MAEYSKKAAVKPKPLSVLRSLEEKYVAVMKKLQFGRLRSGEYLCFRKQILKKYVIC